MRFLYYEALSPVSDVIRIWCSYRIGCLIP